MSKKAATEEVLGNLHSKIAKVMTDALTASENQIALHNAALEDAKNNDDVEAMAMLLSKPKEVNASLLSVITKFLADNSITCQVEKSEELTGLQALLKNKNDARNNVVALRQTN